MSTTSESPRQVARLGMRRLLVFILSCLVASAALAALWATVAASLYLGVLVRVVEAVLGVIGYGQVGIEVRGGTLEFYQLDVLLRRHPLGPMNGLSFTFNTVPLVALLLTTPGARLGTRLGNLLFCCLALSATHLMHILASFYVVTHRTLELPVDVSFFWLRVAVHNGIGYLHTFWEVAGRMLTPFVLWGLAYPEVIVGGLRGIGHPPGRRASAPACETARGGGMEVRKLPAVSAPESTGEGQGDRTR